MTAGFDALTYVRFMGLCLRISIFVAVISLASCLPTNWASKQISQSKGSNTYTDFDHTTMANVKAKSMRLWVHTIALVVIALGIIWVRCQLLPALDRQIPDRPVMRNRLIL
jgi:Late exocytosis, associated with Golgi transport